MWLERSNSGRDGREDLIVVRLDVEVLEEALLVDVTDGGAREFTDVDNLQGAILCSELGVFVRQGRASRRDEATTRGSILVVEAIFQEVRGGPRITVNWSNTRVISAIRSFTFSCAWGVEGGRKCRKEQHTDWGTKFIKGQQVLRPRADGLNFPVNSDTLSCYLHFTSEE